MTFAESWYNANFQMFMLAYPGVWIEIESDAYEWVLIHNFPLPSNFQQQSTRLLMLLPGLTQPVATPPRHYYVNQDLTLTSGRRPKHIFDKAVFHGARELSNLGYAYACVLLTRWRPSADVVSGDNLVSVTNLIYERLEQAV